MRMLSSQRAFTLLELMICCAVTVIALAGVLTTYVTCFELDETMRNGNLAINAAQKVLEEIRSTPFLSVYSNYNGYTFHISGMPTTKSLGRVVVDNTNPNLLKVDVGVCWTQRASRIVGECTPSSGSLVFNDVNGNGKLDSAVAFTTLVAQR